MWDDNLCQLIAFLFPKKIDDVQCSSCLHVRDTFSKKEKKNFKEVVLDQKKKKKIESSCFGITLAPASVEETAFLFRDFEKKKIRIKIFKFQISKYLFSLIQLNS